MLSGKTTKELLEILASQGGRGCWTPEQKAELFGDAKIADRKAKAQSYDDMLMERHRKGLPLSKDARRRVRQLLKGYRR